MVEVQTDNTLGGIVWLLLTVSRQERKKKMSWVGKLLVKLLKLPVYFYKYFISPLTPMACRHVPSCSQYAMEALEKHGPFKGLWLATNRLLHCHPWGTHGYDPVPPVKIDVEKLDSTARK